jgi:hypothetical protein
MLVNNLTVEIDSLYIICISLKTIMKQEGKEEVISAWYMDDSEEDQRLPHHRNPKQFVSLDKLSGT